jgi:hypothetical protein
LRNAEGVFKNPGFKTKFLEMPSRYVPMRSILLAQMAQDAIHARYSPNHSSGTPGTPPTSELAWKHDEFQAILT